MTSRLITPPVGMPVTIEEARIAARVDGTALDAQVEAWVRGITDYAEQYLQRAIIMQTWRVTLDQFPDAIELVMPPLIAVQHLKFIDELGVEQTLDPQDYVVDSVSEPAYLVPAPGTSWPATNGEWVNAMWVDYTCGYGDGPENVPPAIKSFILAKLTQVFDAGSDEVKVGGGFIDRLLDRYINYTR